jgi:hypothetical protein
MLALISLRFSAGSGHIGSFRSIVGEGIRGEKFVDSPFPRRGRTSVTSPPAPQEGRIPNCWLGHIRQSYALSGTYMQFQCGKDWYGHASTTRYFHRCVVEDRVEADGE